MVAPLLEVRATDYHTAGEPFRIVTAGVPAIDGATVPDRRATAQADDRIDVVRRLLCHEPRGHADMYGCFVVPPNAVPPGAVPPGAVPPGAVPPGAVPLDAVPPDSVGAHFGVLFWHKDGYSTACGHGTIALGAWAVETGRVAADPDGVTDVVIDVPSGRVIARVRREGGRTVGVTFRNVPAYVVARNVRVETTRGVVDVDLSWGGALYASLRAADVDLRVTGEHYADLVAIGREVKWLLEATEHARHPSDPRLSGVYGTILFDELPDTRRGPVQRNVTIFAAGAADRSPCGSGTAARVALLADRLGAGQQLVHRSIINSTFVARIAERVTAAGRDAVVAEIDGTAYRTGEHTFFLDAADDLGTGFVLR